MNKLKTIVISGDHSNIGKTQLACQLLKALHGWSALKVTVKSDGYCPSKKSCGVCSGIKEPFSIIKNKEIIARKGKDTARLKQAGAKQVIWLKATSQGLKEGLKKSLAEFDNCNGIVIEGTSVLRHIEPDLTIYLEGKDSQIKPSAKQLKSKADVIVRCQ